VLTRVAVSVLVAATMGLQLEAPAGALFASHRGFIDSELGDVVGNGEHGFLASITPSGNASQITISATNGLASYTIALQPPTGQSLAVGTYDNALIAPTAGNAGLHVTSNNPDGNSCSSVTMG
jgi:hypothetical protein